MVVFDSSSRIRKARFNISGQRVVRGGIPVDVPSPLGGAGGTVDDFVGSQEATPASAPDPMAGGAEALLEEIGPLSSGVKVLPQEHRFTESLEEQRRLYGASALLGVLGGGYL
jgi:hypothetical protein